MARRAIVLAAGRGERLSACNPSPKPLIPVAGVPIIYRTILALWHGGVEELCVVTGHREHEIRVAVEAFAEREQIPVSFVYNDRWREPNGLSVEAAEPFTGGDDFILSMSDHLLDPVIVQLLQSVDSRTVTLAIDEHIDRVYDLDDATMVRCSPDYQISAIGKELREYNAIDCGIFRCTGGVFEALERAFRAGEFSISGGMQVLARQGLFHGVPIGGCYWQDIDTPEMLHASERILARHTLAG